MGRLSINAKTQAATFVNTKLTQFDITFSEGNQHAIFWLKWSKTDIHYLGIEIILTVKNDKRCPVITLHILFICDQQFYTAQLFCPTKNFMAFARKLIIDIFQKRFRVYNIMRAKL